MKKKKPAISPQPELSSSKRRIFFFIMLTSPFAFLLLLEIGLRQFTQGEDLSLFTTEILAGRRLHVMNPAVKSRYFPSVPFNPSTSPDYFEVPKSKGTYRIFCLGGSTTVGYPYWYNGSFSSFLRDRLRTIFPDRTIEVINLGMTATNSFTVNDMAKEVIDYEPDLLIVYDGHNEFYGAMGVASHESIARSRLVTKLYLQLIHFRTFRALQSVTSSITSLFRGEPGQTTSSTMMEKLARGQYIPYGSHLYRDGLTSFKDNLEELASIASSKGVPVLLGSQVSNLRDLPPFISQDEKSNGGLTQQTEFQPAIDLATKYWTNGKIDSALSAFRSASAIDTIRADGHYFIARCLDSLGRYSEASLEYVKARDYDMLRFRTSSDFNAAMHEACDRNKMIFVDMERAFRAHSKDSLIGSELIVEHLHPNSKGFFILAEEYARAMQANNLLTDAPQWKMRDTINDESLWKNRCLTDLDELTAQRRTGILTSGWPFKSQVPQVDAVAGNDTLGQIVEHAVRGQWEWRRTHNAAADYYLGRREWEKAISEYRTIVNQLPLIDVQPYLKLARLYLNKGDFTNARLQLLASLNVSQTILAHRALGDLAMQDHKPNEATKFYEKTVAFSTTPQEQIENGYLLALAYSQAGLGEKASAGLQQILALNPNYQPAAALLSKLRENKKE